MQVEQQVERLNAARARAQQLAAEGSRLEGELTSAKKRRDELEKDCKTKFDCPVNELGNLVAEFKSVGAEELVRAEKILGIGPAEAQADASPDVDESVSKEEIVTVEVEKPISAREAILAREKTNLAAIMKKRNLVSK